MKCNITRTIEHKLHGTIFETETRYEVDMIDDNGVKLDPTSPETIQEFGIFVNVLSHIAHNIIKEQHLPSPD